MSAGWRAEGMKLVSPERWTSTAETLIPVYFETAFTSVRTWSM